MEVQKNHHSWNNRRLLDDEKNIIYFIYWRRSPKLLEDEKELFSKDDPTSVSKLGQQKKEMLGKNLERMAVAHEAVERHDAKIEEYKKANDSSALKREKDLMDGAYSELKKAQEAAAKSIKVKRQQVQMRLTSKKQETDSKD